MLDEKSRQDVDTNLQDVAQIPGRRLRLWSFACRASVRAPMRSMGQGKTGAGSIGSGKNRSISVLPSRFCSGEDRICCFVPPKTFLWYKTPPKVHFVRSKTFIRNQIMWTPPVLYRHHQSGPENGVNNRPFCHHFFKSQKTV